MPMLVKTKLKEVPGKGIGLFLDESVKKDQILYEDDTQFDRILSRKKVLEMPEVLKRFIEVNAAYNTETDTYYLCCDNARFWNHSETPNTFYNSETGRVTALKDIEADEELTSNYREFCDSCKKGDFGFVIK